MCLLHFNKISNIIGDVFCGLAPEFPEMCHSRIIISTKTNALTLRLKVYLIKAAAYRPIIHSQRLWAVQSGAVIYFINLIYGPHPIGSHSSIGLNALYNPVLVEFTRFYSYHIISEKERANFATQS